jgi:hypothetical protein
MMSGPSLLLLVSLGAAGTEADDPAVVIGQIERIEMFDSDYFKQARSLYTHDTWQSFVLKIEQQLAGPELPDRVIVLMDVYPVDHYSVKRKKSWYLLSAKEWRIGTKIVVALSSRSRYGGPCFVKGPDSDDPGYYYLDPMINENRELSVRCADIKNTYRIRSSTRGVH